MVNNEYVSMDVLVRICIALDCGMDANEYKDYLLGIVFYKYLSDSFLIKGHDLIYDEKPDTLKIALVSQNRIRLVTI